jgi:predicted AAA+ superfamily ATPase
MPGGFTMLAILKEIILDFQEIDLPTGVPRRVAISPVPGKATVCIGVRRSGKSTFMFQLMKKLHDSGVSRQNTLYLNFSMIGCTACNTKTWA